MLRESLDIARHTGEKRVIAFALQHLGSVVARDGDVVQGRQLMQESLQLSRDNGDGSRIARVLAQLARWDLHASDYMHARELLVEALTTARKSGDRQAIALSLEVLGQVEAVLARPNEAHRIWEQSIVTWRELGDRSGVVTVRGLQGSLAIQHDDDTKARAAYLECIRHMQVSERIPVSLKSALEGLAVLASKLQNWQQVLILVGAGDHLNGGSVDLRTATFRAMYEQAITQARQELGEELATAAWAEGQALTLDDAYNLAVAVASDESAIIDI